MISWLGARSDVPHYGRSVVYQFSESTTVFGPTQVEAAINQDPAISVAAVAVGPAGFAGDPRQPHHRADRGHAALRAAAVPAERSDAAAAAQARDRLLPDAGEGGPAAAPRATPSRSWSWRRRWRGACRRLRRAASTARHMRPGTGGGTGTAPAEERRRHRRRPQRRRPRARSSRPTPSSRPRRTAQQAGDWAEYGRQVEALEQALTDLQRLQQQ